MEQIPLPSSPDSPGPPGEEHIEKDKFIKKPNRHSSPEKARKDDSRRLTYSPSMETSSPEYDSGKDPG